MHSGAQSDEAKRGTYKVFFHWGYRCWILNKDGSSKAENLTSESQEFA
jgi:hypothetical protein